MPKPERRDAAKERRWRRLLRLWRGSGQTGRDFCAAHQLSEPSFYAWRREIARRDREVAERTQAQRTRPTTTSTNAALPAFLNVTLAAVTPTPAIEVVLAQGRSLRVASGFDPDLLRQLLRVLEGPAC
ncbi:MAG: hypothetical protein K2R98_08210 [Gemmataceae bacterium]|nr:hypothetical protein [Gemmataceae bacterium]